MCFSFHYRASGFMSSKELQRDRAVKDNPHLSGLRRMSWPSGACCSPWGLQQPLRMVQSRRQVLYPGMLPRGEGCWLHDAEPALRADSCIKDRCGRLFWTMWLLRAAQLHRLESHSEEIKVPEEQIGYYEQRYGQAQVNAVGHNGHNDRLLLAAGRLVALYNGPR